MCACPFINKNPHKSINYEYYHYSRLTNYGREIKKKAWEIIKVETIMQQCSRINLKTCKNSTLISEDSDVQ